MATVKAIDTFYKKEIQRQVERYERQQAKERKARRDNANYWKEQARRAYIYTDSAPRNSTRFI